MAPLLLAARSGQDGVVKLLLERGADITATDADGRNCLDIAIDRGYRQLLFLFFTLQFSKSWGECLHVYLFPLFRSQRFLFVPNIRRIHHVFSFGTPVFGWKHLYAVCGGDPIKAYLPGTGETVIMKAVRPERGLAIALRLGWPLRSPQMWVTRVRNLW